MTTAFPGRRSRAYFDEPPETFTGERRLCARMAVAVSGVAPTMVDDFWASVPWLTPVVGSGCLPSLHVEGFTSDRLVSELTRQVRALTVRQEGMTEEVLLADLVPVGSESFATMAEAFAGSLYADRVRLPPDQIETDRQSEGAEWQISAPAARQVLIAALLTRLAHGLRAVDPRALGRHSDEVIEINGRLPACADPYRLVDTVVSPLRRLLGQPVETTLGLDPLLVEGIGRLNRRILEWLNGARPDAAGSPTTPRIALNDVRLATEAAWYFLVRPLDMYFGWSELIVGLTLRHIDERGRRHRRPYITDLYQEGLDEAVKTLRAVLDAPTALSWQRTSPEHPSIYRSVAGALSRQCELNRLGGLRSATMANVPVAVAYSTSFDLELEMALFRAGTPYSVALPVYAKLGDSRKGDDDGSLEVFWVVGDVDPPARFDRIAPPREVRNLANLRAFQWNDHVDRRRPLVVRLTGCPLYELDRSALRRAAESVNIAPSRSNPEAAFGLALDYDEHFALRQSQAEMLWASLDDRPQASGEGLPTDRDRGLHRGHLRDGEFRPSSVPGPGGPRSAAPGRQVRFWALLGVPTEDPVIRRRVVTLFNLRAIASMKGAGDGRQRAGAPAPALARGGTGPQADFFGLAQPSPADPSNEAEDSVPTDDDDVAGVLSFPGFAANTSVDDDEAALLEWLGLTVVRRSVADFIPGIDHYGDAHLLRQVAFSRTECHAAGLDQ